MQLCILQDLIGLQILNPEIWSLNQNRFADLIGNNVAPV